MLSFEFENGNFNLCVSFLFWKNNVFLQQTVTQRGSSTNHVILTLADEVEMMFDISRLHPSISLFREE